MGVSNMQFGQGTLANSGNEQPKSSVYTYAQLTNPSTYAGMSSQQVLDAINQGKFGSGNHSISDITSGKWNPNAAAEAAAQGNPSAYGALQNNGSFLGGLGSSISGLGKSLIDNPVTGASMGNNLTDYAMMAATIAGPAALAEGGVGAGGTIAGGSGAGAVGGGGADTLGTGAGMTEADAWASGAGASGVAPITGGSAAAGGGFSIPGMLSSPSVPSWLSFAGNLYGASQAGKTGPAAAAADPFASQRPQYQAMLSNLFKDPSAFLQSPFVQSQLKTGTDAINRASGATGHLGSGNRLAELDAYGQNLAQKSLMDYASLLGKFGGADSGSPGQAGQIIQQGNTDQTNGYLHALDSGLSLMKYYGNSNSTGNSGVYA